MNADCREGVSHIITQYTEREQVLRQLQRDGAPGINSDADLEQVKVVTLAWLSACLKAGRTVAVEEKHIVKCKQTTQVWLPFLTQEAFWW